MWKLVSARHGMYPRNFQDMPVLAAQRAAKRESLLATTEEELDGICVIHTSAAEEKRPPGHPDQEYRQLRREIRVYQVCVYRSKPIADRLRLVAR